MRQRNAISFRKRQHWETAMRVKFSQTIRRRMRDPALFSAENIWTESEATLAEELLLFVRREPALSDDAVPAAFVDAATPANFSYDAALTQTVWQRLQHWPHDLALQHARGLLR